MNALAELSPALYAAAIVGVVILVAGRLRALDGTHGQAPHDLPDRIDPYEIAYLRGGTNELARVVIVSLVERQLLELKRPDGGLSRFVFGKKYIAQRVIHVRPRLSPLEETVYEWFAKPRSTADIFKAALPGLLRTDCLPFEERLQRHRLLRTDSDEPRGPVVATGLMALMTIAVLGINTGAGGFAGLVVAMSVAGMLAIAALTIRKRVTVHGRRYLTQLRERLGEGQTQTSPTLAVAVGGTAVLAATPLSDLGAEFKKAQRAQSAGSGAACGGGIFGTGCSSGCGGGCGGGGGGCGGG